MGRRTARTGFRPSFDALEQKALMSSFGVNVKGNDYELNNPIWVDVRHLFRAWGQVVDDKYYTDPKLQVTAEGYPLSSAGTSAQLQNYPDGQYEFSYRGAGQLAFDGIGANVGPITVDSDGLSHGYLKIDHTQFNHLTLFMTVSGVDPSNPLTDIRITEPGYDHDTTQVYTNEFLHSLEPFSDIRFVEWTKTIDSTLANWADRVLPDDFCAISSAGVSYEEIIELANEAHKDLWINVPALATPDFVQQLAQLIHDRLDSDLNVYVEYSNETWSTAWLAYSQVLASAKKNPLVDRPSDVGKIAEQSAYQIKQIGDTFRQVFGADSARVRPIFAGWAAVPNYQNVGLNFLQENYGDPSQYLYAVAIAPYVPLAGGTDNWSLTLTSLFDSLNQSLQSVFVPYLQQNVAIANNNHLPLVTYEGGQGINGFTYNTALKTKAQTDPRMYDFYRQMITLWNQYAGNLFTFYSLNGGFWGLLTSVSDPGSPKWDGVMSSILTAGDANLDGQVDLRDLAIVESNLGKSSAWWEQGDFDHDGIVGDSDVRTLLDNLTQGSMDQTTEGGWVGTYGDAGYSLAGDLSSLPSYATVTMSGQSPITWSSGTSDVRGLQKATKGSSDRIAAAWSGSQFTVDINITDGETHSLSVYAVDWDSSGRSEQIKVVNGDTGAVLDSQTLSSFQNGTYLTWAVQGHVQLQVTSLAGPNAVLSGLFLGQGSVQVFNSIDTSTQGNWIGTYGAGGYNIIGDLASIPSYATVTPSGQSTYTWKYSTTDVRALQKADTGATDRIASCWYGQKFTVDINLPAGASIPVSIYALDWSNSGRSERIDVLSATDGSVLDSRTLSSFQNGVYVTWNLQGHVKLVVTSLLGPNAVLNGLFFGTSTSTSTTPFVSADTMTQGNWKGTYGADGYNVLGDTSSYPSYATVTPSGQSPYVWNSSTTDVRGLQKAARGSTTRIAACWYNSTQFSVDINLTDGQSHRVSIYAADWTNIGRSQRVDVIDAATGAVLDSQTLSSFGKGVYLTWNLSGHVKLRFTNLGPGNAVLNGLFFG